MKIIPVGKNYTAFKSSDTSNSKPAVARKYDSLNNADKMAAKTEVEDNKNPIKKGYEQLDALRATVTAGLGFGFYALYYLSKEGFAFDTLFDASLKIAKQNESKTKRALLPLMYIGSMAFVFAGFIGALAVAYTAFNAPKAMYNGKINAFKKEKEMDLYIRGNKVEKELYNQMNAAAKNADSEQKKALSLQYQKLRAAKNIVPDFVDIKMPLTSNNNQSV